MDAASEAQVLDKLVSLRKHGLDFIQDECACPGKRLKLTAVPALKQFQLDSCDMDELMLSVSQTASLPVPVLERIARNFASKACRMSIMVGRSLDHKEMKRILEHLSEIDQPWVSVQYNLLVLYKHICIELSSWKTYHTSPF